MVSIRPCKPCQDAGWVVVGHKVGVKPKRCKALFSTLTYYRNKLSDNSGSLRYTDSGKDMLFDALMQGELSDDEESLVVDEIIDSGDFFFMDGAAHIVGSKHRPKLIHNLFRTIDKGEFDEKEYTMLYETVETFFDDGLAKRKLLSCLESAKDPWDTYVRLEKGNNILLK